MRKSSKRFKLIAIVLGAVSLVGFIIFEALQTVRAELIAAGSIIVRPTESGKIAAPAIFADFEKELNARGFKNVASPSVKLWARVHWAGEIEHWYRRSAHLAVITEQVSGTQLNVNVSWGDRNFPWVLEKEKREADALVDELAIWSRDYKTVHPEAPVVASGGE